MLFQQSAEILFGLEDSSPGIAMFSQQLRDGEQGKVGRIDLFQLLPGDRHRDGAERMPARAEDGSQRFAATVLVVVEEDLSGAPLDRPLQGDITRPLLL